MEGSDQSISVGGIQDRRARKVEILISHLLRVGVVSSLCVILAGMVLTFVHHPAYLSSRSELGRLLGPNEASPASLREVAIGVGQLQGRAVVELGLLLLLATPVMRVAVSIFAFIYERDPTFVVLTSIVLALLLLSFVLGKAVG